MPRFACPLCKAVVTVDADQRGAVIACTSCEKKIRVPPSKSAGQAIQTRPASRGGIADRDEDDEDIPIRGKSRQTGPRREPLPSKDSDADLAVRSGPPRRKSPDPDFDDAEDLEDRPKPPTLPRKRRVVEDDEDTGIAPTPRPARSSAKKKRTRDEDADDEDIDDLAEVDEDDDEQDEDDDRTKKKRRKKKEQEGGALVAVTGFISSITALAALAIFVLIVSGAGPRWLMDFIEEKLRDSGIPPIVAITITALVFLIPIGLWVLFTLKGQILRAMPDELDFRTTKTSKFPDLDIDQLEETTADLERLGFDQVVDYTVVTELENFPTGFARLFINDEEGCFAEVNQGFTPAGDSVPMRCVIISHMDDEWSLSTTDRTPNKESYLMRRPRAAWRSHPEKDIAGLLSQHRKMRKKMMKGLEVGLDERLSKAAYFEREKAANRERKDVVRGRWTPGILIEFFFFDRNPKFEWLGEYAGVADD